tara:strand:+ start:9442 stop:9798 length:357 start_codon:yes stop_codon:yes gene_type:complete
MRNDEHEVQKAICQYLDIRKIFYFAIPNGGKRSKSEAGKFRAEGVKSGIPDLCLLMNGIAFFLEVKRPKNGKTPKGRLTANQQIMIEKIEDAGSDTAVVYSVADVIGQLIDWGFNETK